MNHHPRIKIEAEERLAVVLSFIYYFCVLGSYYVMRPIRDQLAAEVGTAKLVWFFGITFLVSICLTPVFGWLVSRFRRQVSIPAVYIFFICCQLIFVGLFFHKNLLSPQTLGICFFVWLSVFNLFVVSVFWSFMTDIWSDAQAKRLFPIIALGGTTGAVTGPLITGSLVETIGQSLLLFVAACLLSIAVGCILILGKWARKYQVDRNKRDIEAAVEGSIFDGLKQIFSSPFIISMSIIMLLNDAVGTIAYVLTTSYSGMTFMHDAIAQTRFAAKIDLSANLIQIIVQLTITRWLLVKLGVGMVFAIYASFVGLVCLTMTLVGNPYQLVMDSIPWIALILIITRSLSYGMMQPARETLYTLVSREIRFKGKNTVDTVVWRAGDVLSLLSINQALTYGINIGAFGAISAILIFLSGIIGWHLANSVSKTQP